MEVVRIMNNLKKISKFLLIFFIILIFNLIFSPINGDEVWNYGFANNLYQGLIPYKDFNMVLTPFYPFLMSIPFYIFGSNMLIFHITNALLITGCFILLDKDYKDKMWIILLFCFFPINYSFPTYNMFLYVLLCTILFLENNYVKDENIFIHYIIGFLLGITFLTKQTVGGCLVLVSLYYIKDFKIILKRFFGFLIPITIFIIYILFNNAWKEFIDLCILGLIDFSGNQQGFSLNLLFYVVMIFIIFKKIKKDKNNITLYYVLAFFSIAIPIVDAYHTAYCFLAFLLIILKDFKKKYFHYHILSTFSIIFLGLLTLNFNKGFPLKNYPNDINHFKYRFINEESYYFTKDISEFLEENASKKIIFLSSNAYYFKIINDLPCTYLDLINRGNWGYNGSEKLLKKVKEAASNKAIFILDPDETIGFKQTDKQALNYVIKNGKKIKSIKLYDIYTFE